MRNCNTVKHLPPLVFTETFIVVLKAYALRPRPPSLTDIFCCENLFEKAPYFFPIFQIPFFFWGLLFSSNIYRCWIINKLLLQTFQTLTFSLSLKLFSFFSFCKNKINLSLLWVIFYDGGFHVFSTDYASSPYPLNRHFF